VTRLETIADLCRKGQVADSVEKCNGYFASIERYCEMSDQEFILRGILQDKRDPVVKALLKEVKRAFPE